MAWNTCSYCEQPIQGHCGRCSKAFCTVHARDHWVHPDLAVTGTLMQELDDILAGFDAKRSPETSESNTVARAAPKSEDRI